MKALIHRFCRLVSEARKQRSPIFWEDIVAFVLLSFGISAILVAGPYTQALMIAMIFGNSTSIYANLVDLGVGYYDALGDWLEAATFPGYFVIAVLVAFAIANQDKPRGVIIRASIVFFLGLTILDSFHIATYGSDENNALYVNIISNALGAPLLASLVLAALKCHQSICDGKPIADFRVALLTATIPGVTLLITSCVVFIGGTWFFKVAETSIRISFQSITKGAYGSGQSTGRFGFLRDVKHSGANLSWYGVSKDARLSISKATIYSRIEVYAITGCTEPSQLAKIRLGPPLLKTDGAENVALTLDNGLVQAFISGTGLSGFDFDVTDESAGLFWVDAGKKKDEESNLTVFTSADQGIVGSMGTRPLIFQINSWFIDRAGDGRLKVTSRKVDIAAGSTQYSLVFEPNKNINWEAPLRCRQLRVPAMKSGDSHTVTTDALIAGIILKVSAVKPMPVASLPSLGGFSLRGLNGWLKSAHEGQLPINALVRPGAASYVHIIGKTTQVHVSGEDLTPKEVDAIEAFGELQVSIGPSDGVVVTGSANSIYRDGILLNKTRWENLGTEWLLALLTTISGLIVVAVRAFYSILKENEDMPVLWRRR